jgi:hypothetical protein
MMIKIGETKMMNKEEKKQVRNEAIDSFLESFKTTLEVMKRDFENSANDPKNALIRDSLIEYQETIIESCSDIISALEKLKK